MAVVVATGITADGGREVLGLDVGDSEDEVFWRGFLTGLKRRGLSGVRLVISDQHAGLVAALTRCFQGAAHQRCRVHFAHNLLALVPKTHTDMAAAVFRTICAQPTRTRSPPPGMKCATSSPAGSPKSALSWTRRKPRCWRSPRSPERTGRRSGAPTHWSGSTRRSSAGPGSWGSSPTMPPSSGSSEPSSPTCTTSGSQATAATCPRPPWPNSTNQPY